MLLSDEKSLHDARRMLVALLAKPNDGPVTGLDEISTGDRLFLLSTCSAMVIQHAICRSCGYRSEAALAGLDALVVSMREQIEKLCRDMRPL